MTGADKVSRRITPMSKKQLQTKWESWAIVVNLNLSSHLVGHIIDKIWLNFPLIVYNKAWVKLLAASDLTINIKSRLIQKLKTPPNWVNIFGCPNSSTLNTLPYSELRLSWLRDLDVWQLTEQEFFSSVWILVRFLILVSYICDDKL